MNPRQLVLSGVFLCLFVCMVFCIIFACMETQRMNVKIPKEQYDKLKKIKEDLGLNMQEVISIALNIYFKKIENANSNG